MSVNKTGWCRLGNFIEEVSLRVGNNQEIAISGVNIEKGFIPTVANMTGIDTSKYKLVPTGHFACNLMHVGRDVTIPIAYNQSDDLIAVSPAYYVFTIKAEMRSSILSEYLEMLLTRTEFGRLAWFHTDGSIRGNLPEKAFHEILIPLPSIEVQKELVATYNGLKSLAEHNEALVGPLSNACEALITNCKKKYRCIPIGDSIEIKDQKNKDDIDYEIYGINKEKTFMPTHADTNELDKSKYKIVCKEDFVFSGMQTGRDVCIRLALYDDTKPIIVSPAYTTFRVINPHVLPKYLFLHFKRQEMDRYGWFLSDGSVRSNLDWDRFCEIQIPLPPVEIQESIVNLYNCLEEAKKIASEARERLKSLCPALIQRAINS